MPDETTERCYWCEREVQFEDESRPNLGVEIALLKGPLDKFDRIVTACIECCEMNPRDGGQRWELA